MYPVPAKDQVTISSNANIANIMVVNLLGAVIKKQTSIDSKEYILDVSSYAAGTYFVRVSSNQEETINKKIIVSN